MFVEVSWVRFSLLLLRQRRCPVDPKERAQTPGKVACISYIQYKVTRQLPLNSERNNLFHWDLAPWKVDRDASIPHIRQQPQAAACRLQQTQRVRVSCLEVVRRCVAAIGGTGIGVVCASPTSEPPSRQRSSHRSHHEPRYDREAESWPHVRPDITTWSPPTPANCAKHLLRELV